MRRADGQSSHIVIDPRADGVAVLSFVNDCSIGFRDFDDWRRPASGAADASIEQDRGLAPRPRVDGTGLRPAPERLTGQRGADTLKPAVQNLMAVWQRFVTPSVCVVLMALPAAAADLEPRTVAAFDRYVAVTGAQAAAVREFLAVDALAEPSAGPRWHALRRGELVIDRPRTTEGGQPIDIPSGLVHHWRGTAFIPGATVAQAVALLQDYDRHAEIYPPNVARSRDVVEGGDVYRVDLRFYMKKVITVVVNSEHEARFSWPAPDRAQSRIHSLRIAEVEDPTRRVSARCRSGRTAAICGG